MSLICHETRKDIEFGDPLMVAFSRDRKAFTALSQEVLSKIPQHLKSDVPGQVDIHVAVSKRNFNGSYTVTTGFKAGDFLYSISEETARRFLPRYADDYYPIADLGLQCPPPIGADW